MSEHNRDLVIAKAKSEFPAEDVDKILAILDGYGTEPYEREQARVQVAMLMLSKGSIEELQRLVTAAKRDYRDVLAWAEYPEELRLPTWRMPADQVREIRLRDRKQYKDWLDKV